VVGGRRSPLMRPMMAWNAERGSAAPAIWKSAERALLHEAGASLDYSLEQGRERPSLHRLRQSQRAYEIAEVPGQRV